VTEQLYWGWFLSSRHSQPVNWSLTYNTGRVCVCVWLCGMESDEDWGVYGYCGRMVMCVARSDDNYHEILS
jgi:hypothetical protein